MRWVRILSHLYQSQKEVKAGEKGFEVDPGMIRADGKIMRTVLEYEPGDVTVYDIVDRLFGYI